jgi:hypothetical protein
MNSSTEIESTAITAREIPESERLTMLPRHFGRHMMTVERAVYNFMRSLVNDYAGGYWKFVELSNGGCYMAPETSKAFQVRVDGNGYEGSMSPEAAGITVCLFAFSHLSFQIEDESLSKHYYWLRDFAFEHREASAIFAAID